MQEVYRTVNCVEVSISGWEALGNAVVEQAVRDYMNSYGPAKDMVRKFFLNESYFALFTLLMVSTY